MDVVQVFSEIYAQHRWGGNKKVKFASGPGSWDVYTDRYCELINSFVTKHDLRTVVDLGCGDFLVGRRIARPEILYIGLDVVKDLIEHNASTFGSDHIRFQQANLIRESLPDGDLCLIRQVFQHLSNEEIALALEKCTKYKYVIVTEHVPDGNFKANLDKPHGPDIRLWWNSGISLDQPPFLKKCEILLDTPDSFGFFRTALIENSPTPLLRE
jgi:SAM-dependent methyltransferase